MLSAFTAVYGDILGDRNLTCVGYVCENEAMWMLWVGQLFFRLHPALLTPRAVVDGCAFAHVGMLGQGMDARMAR
jgi:hypothetical protein